MSTHLALFPAEDKIKGGHPFTNGCPPFSALAESLQKTATSDLVPAILSTGQTVHTRICLAADAILQDCSPFRRLAPLDAVYQPFQGGMSSDDGDHTQIRTGKAVDTIFFHDIAPPQAPGHLDSEGCRIDILG